MTLFYEPFAPLFELSRQVDRLLSPSGGAVRSFVPTADVVVTDDEVTVTLDVPGLKEEDISIELEGDTLAVRGERPMPDAIAEDETTGSCTGMSSATAGSSVTRVSPRGSTPTLSPRR